MLWNLSHKKEKQKSMFSKVFFKFILNLRQYYAVALSCFQKSWFVKSWSDIERSTATGIFLPLCSLLSATVSLNTIGPQIFSYRHPQTTLLQPPVASLNSVKGAEWQKMIKLTLKQLPKLLCFCLIGSFSSTYPQFRYFVGSWYGLENSWSDDVEIWG